MWQKGLMGIAFGLLLLFLLLLPNDLGPKIAVAGILVATIASLIGLLVARVLLNRVEDPGQIGRVGGLIAWVSIVSTIAIALIALMARSLWVLWLWSASAGLGIVAYMVFALRGSMPRFDSRPH